MDNRVVVFNKLKSLFAELGICTALTPFLIFFPSSILLNLISFSLGGKIIFDLSSFIKIFNNFVNEMRIELDSKEWQELCTKYNMILNKVMLLTNYLELENPIEIYALYVYLYRNGYLSYNKNFVYAVNDVKDILNLYGLDVIRGKGCCRNVSLLLKGLYDIKDLKNEMFFGLALTSSFETDIDLSLAPLNKNLKEEITEDEFLKVMKPLEKIIGNHLINCVKFDNKVCWLDATNDLLLYRIDKKLYPALGDEALLGKIRVFNVKGTKSYDKKEFFSDEPLSFEDYKTLYEKTNRLIETNQDVFEKFYLDNKDSYEEIYELMEKYPFGNSENIKSKKIIY